MFQKFKEYLKNGGGVYICIAAGLIIAGAALATFSNL